MIPTHLVGRSASDKGSFDVTGSIADAFRVLRVYAQSLLVDIESIFWTIFYFRRAQRVPAEKPSELRFDQQ